MVQSSLSAYRALASESRVAILHVLQERAEPARVDDIAAAVGLHINTAREHLDRLVATGFVEREPEVRTTRGRPRILYRAVDRAAGATLDRRAREQLTHVLVAGYGKALASPAAAAEAAGEAWAAAMPSAGVSEPSALAQVAALETHFEDLGFEPEVDLTALEVHLRRCPIADLARERTEVVCSVHLGLARGVLARAEGPLTTDRLEPFVGPDHCVLYLRSR
ncbi:metalloregulator ArsR/SmtB family transcription factor [Actinotalea sp. K2]|uniref:helix-turn-helix transcriptional regulator n=1 Tax=Actinotalea sp. K2 TaxID=2939438 RepID=UPI002017FB54|nr:helix-turn-helix domain-containing protein [Actinotalea sp. K2]MCL3862771.1 helix-turn-helix domain-containing protein [Actinotalea sp. K2]